nr:hypothetical protein [Staphylococcus lugdunensis]
MLLRSVCIVKENLLQTNTAKEKHAVEDALTNKEPKTEKIKSIKFHSIQDVYNMEVEKYHNYAVEGGLIIHNCIDALRYSVEMLMINNKKQKKKASDLRRIKNMF